MYFTEWGSGVGMAWQPLKQRWIIIRVFYKLTQKPVNSTEHKIFINQSKTCLYQNQPRGNGSYSFNPYIYIILIHQWNKQHFYRNSSPVCSKFAWGLNNKKIKIIITRNGAKTISLQTSFGDLIRNGAKTISLQSSFGN